MTVYPNRASLPAGWESQVLAGIGAPDTGANRLSLDIWNQSEGSPDLYNPFGTTLAEPGSKGTNSVGVQSYADWQTGLAATVSELKQTQGVGNNTAIVNALKQSADISAFENAVAGTHWGTKTFAGGFTPSPETNTGLAALPGVLGTTLNPANYGAGVSQSVGAIGSGVASLGSDAFSSALKGLTSSGLLLRGTLIVVGLVILFIGISQLGKGGQGAGSTLAGGTESVTVHVASPIKKAAKAAPEAVAA